MEPQTQTGLFDADSLDAALGIVEELVETSSELKKFFTRLKLTGELQTEALALSSKLESLVNLIDENSIPIPALDKGLLSPRHKGIIERLGIGSELIRLREHENKTIAEIAALHNLCPQTVSRFFKYYASLKPSQQVKVRKSSVFDTTERLEDLMTMIMSQLARLQGSNDEVAVRYTDQLRQTIQMAAQLTEKMTNYAAYQTFTKSVVEILLTELPGRRNEILSKIQVIGKTQELLKPNL